MPRRRKACDYAAVLRRTTNKLIAEFDAMSPLERELLEDDVLHPVASAIWHARTIIASCRMKPEDFVAARQAFHADFAKMWHESEE